MKPKIGIVSGVGPLAGSDVFAKILKIAAYQYDAVQDNEYPDAILINHGIEGVDNTGSLNTQFEQEITRAVHQLEKQGATIIGIACNTAHVYLDSIKIKKSTTLINLIDEVAKKTVQSVEPYLLMTSRTSKEQRLYQNYLKKYEVKFEETQSEDQKILDEIIELIMSHRLSEAGRLMDKALKQTKEDGFRAVIAGCTELPIAITYSTEAEDLTIVDSNQVLAEALTDRYYK